MPPTSWYTEVSDSKLPSISKICSISRVESHTVQYHLSLLGYKSYPSLIPLKVNVLAQSNGILLNEAVIDRHSIFVIPFCFCRRYDMSLLVEMVVLSDLTTWTVIGRVQFPRFRYYREPPLSEIYDKRVLCIWIISLRFRRRTKLTIGHNPLIISWRENLVATSTHNDCIISDNFANNSGDPRECGSVLSMSWRWSFLTLPIPARYQGQAISCRTCFALGCKIIFKRSYRFRTSRD